MDLLRNGHGKQEDARAQDSAIMLFGKHITNLSAKDDAEKIKEELSPRGVDEKGLSLATSSDDDDDENYQQACEDTMHVMQSASTPMASVLACESSDERSKKRKGTASDCIAPDADAEKPKSSAVEPAAARMGAGDNPSAKLKGGMWSRCPRCNSADTKFCYFNNYNVNQPRHFCKNCQRYWTAGGTLRNVPIGAGKRKNKHALHKHAFLANSASSLTAPMSSLPVDVRDPGLCSLAKSDPLSATTESGPLSIMKPNAVNTNLELSVCQSLTDSPIPSLPPCNIIHPHSAHQLITLHQLQENLQSRFSQINHPHLASGCSKLGQIYPNLACGPSPLSPCHPELADGCPKFSQLYPNSASGAPGLSQIGPFSPNGSHGLGQVCPHLHGAFSGVSQIWADLQSGSSEMARLGPHIQSGSCRLCNTYPHVQSESCKTSPECLDCKGKECPESAKSGRGFPEMDEVKGDSAHELPMPDQKYASLDTAGLPNLARSASEKSNLENKASSFQIGHLRVDPHEALKYMQRINETRGGPATDECKAHIRGACNGMMETKAPPMCVQGDRTRVASTTALRIKPEEVFNMEGVMKRGEGEGHNSLPIWGGLWPCFYNMLWLDPLALSQCRPILTPQGWALPFIPPSACKVEPTSDSPRKISTPTTIVSENFDCSSTLTPTTALLANVSNGTACGTGNTSAGQHYIETPPTTL